MTAYDAYLSKEANRLLGVKGKPTPGPFGSPDQHMQYYRARVFGAKAPSNRPRPFDDMIAAMGGKSSGTPYQNYMAGQGAPMPNQAAAKGPAKPAGAKPAGQKPVAS